MRIGLESSGDFKKTEAFLKAAQKGDFFKNLSNYGQKGVQALRSATPVDSGLTASSWGFRVLRSRTSPGIEWYNTNTSSGTNVAILIQYGHGTGTGGYVAGRDYINPAIRPIFDQIVDDIWRQVRT